MKKAVLLLPALLMILLVASACGQSQPAAEPAAAHAEEVARFRVEVSRNGFDGNKGAFELDVERGQEVEITFVYGDSDFVQNNPHQITIPDYGIKTEILDENNPEVVVRFTVTSSGPVSFMCANATCVGHPNLLGGRVVPHGH